MKEDRKESKGQIIVDDSDPDAGTEVSFPYKNVKIRTSDKVKDFYDLKAELGRGKFGTVFLCFDKESGTKLAAKFISTPKKEDKISVEREIEIMSHLKHPRLLQLYDAFDHGKEMCLLLEMVEGGELFDRVIEEEFILTERACAMFVRQICEGVAYMHDKNILHLDLKPENVLCLTKTGNRIKIIDFGLARKFDPRKNLQVLFGTPEFVAPEVVNFDTIGFGTDIWSVGVITYVLLSGLSPFMGGSDSETMGNVTVAKYDFTDEAFDDISDEAKEFIEKILVKDMKVRPNATQALQHCWLSRTRAPTTVEQKPLDTRKLKRYVVKKRWVRLVNTILALKRMGANFAFNTL